MSPPKLSVVGSNDKPVPLPLEAESFVFLKMPDSTVFLHNTQPIDAVRAVELFKAALNEAADKEARRRASNSGPQPEGAA